jgi:hypothetical protein
MPCRFASGRLTLVGAQEKAALRRLFSLRTLAYSSESFAVPVWVYGARFGEVAKALKDTRDNAAITATMMRFMLSSFG